MATSWNIEIAERAHKTPPPMPELSYLDGDAKAECAISNERIEQGI
jgi:hypothetical protein